MTSHPEAKAYRYETHLKRVFEEHRLIVEMRGGGAILRKAKVFPGDEGVGGPGGPGGPFWPDYKTETLYHFSSSCII